MISIIIPLYNDENNISQCLEALRDELKPEDEVILVDNGSTDGSLERVLQFQGLVIKVMRLEIGTVAAVRNLGASQASGDILAFIDSDCLVQRGWREAAVQRLCGDRTIGATGSKCLVPVCSPWFVQAWFSQRRPDGDIIYINSGNFLVRKAAFEAAGGFNEALVTGEDAEICLRLRRLGYRIVEDSAVAVVHLGNPQNLYAFYRQQKWHALGMLGTVHRRNIDKPFLMTVIFGLCILLTFVLFAINGFSLSSIIMGGGLLIAVPILSSLYRCWSSRAWKYLPHFLMLFILYFSARLRVLLALLSGTGNGWQKRVK